MTPVPKPQRKCAYCNKIISHGKYCGPLCQQKMGKRRLRARRRSLLHESDLDPIWSKLVKSRANNKCEYCGKTENLNSHHIFGRSNRAVRWSINNGVCLCTSCHEFSTVFSAHMTPTLFTAWIIQTRGQLWHDNLVSESRKTLKVNQITLADKLSELQS